MSSPRTTRYSLRSRGNEISPDEVEAHPPPTTNMSRREGSVERGISTPEKPPNWRKDKSSILLLLFLYVLQGIPLGLAGSVPLILQQRKISYRQQATFSLVFWPFSLKLIWAPIVDAVYSDRMGRRKSWLVPVQYLLAVVMLWLSQVVDSLLGGQGEGSHAPDVGLLTAAFFLLNFFAATQDIAVDGWALTMLAPENVGYASTCNTVGQTAGYFLANVVFLALESADFCNTYLRSTPQPEGIVTLASFLFFWGLVFLITTTLVWTFKHERVSRDDEQDGGNLAGNILSTYRQLYSILKIHQVQIYLFCTVFSKVSQPGVCLFFFFFFFSGKVKSCVVASLHGQVGNTFCVLDHYVC